MNTEMQEGEQARGRASSDECWCLCDSCGQSQGWVVTSRTLVLERISLRTSLLETEEPPRGSHRSSDHSRQDPLTVPERDVGETSLPFHNCRRKVSNFTVRNPSETTLPTRKNLSKKVGKKREKRSLKRSKGKQIVR